MQSDNIQSDYSYDIMMMLTVQASSRLTLGGGRDGRHHCGTVVSDDGRRENIRDSRRCAREKDLTSDRD